LIVRQAHHPRQGKRPCLCREEEVLGHKRIRYLTNEYVSSRISFLASQKRTDTLAF
jgi:hypothetical protein